MKIHEQNYLLIQSPRGHNDDVSNFIYSQYILPLVHNEEQMMHIMCN